MTFSLPSVIGAKGIVGLLEPRLEEQEQAALQGSIDALRSAAERVKSSRGDALNP